MPGDEMEVTTQSSNLDVLAKAVSEAKQALALRFSMMEEWYDELRGEFGLMNPLTFC